MKTSTFDIEYQICSRAILNSLTFGAQADGANEVVRDVDSEWETLDGTLMNHTFEDINTDAAKTKM